MATLHRFCPELSDALGRPAANDDIAHWLVSTSASLFRLADQRARASVRGRRRTVLLGARGRPPAAEGVAEHPLLTHPDPDVRLLAELAGRLGEAAAQLSPIPPEVDEIPF